MLGIVLFMFSLLCYIRRHVGELRISIAPAASHAGEDNTVESAYSTSAALVRTVDDLSVVWDDRPAAEEEFAVADK